MRDRVQRDRVPYDQWVRDGRIVATPGAVVDYDAVRAVLSDWDDRFDLRDVAFDPWNATDLITRLQDQDGLTCVKMRQGFPTLSAPSKALEAAIVGGRLRHDGDPVLRWMVSNVAVETDAAGNIKPSKAKSTEKIDGVVALIMALDRLDRNAGVKDKAYQMLIVGE